MSSDPTRPPFLLVLYQQYLTHQDSACFVREVLCLYTTGTLQRLADMLAVKFAARRCFRSVLSATTMRTTRWASPAGRRPHRPHAGRKRHPHRLDASGKRSRTQRTRRDPSPQCRAIVAGRRRQGHQVDRTGAVVRRGMASTRRGPGRPRTTDRVDSRLPSDARNQPVPFRRRNEHGPSLSATRQPGLRAGVLSPGAAAESRSGRGVRPGRPTDSDGRRGPPVVP